MVHNGRELLSEAGYFHSFSMDNDPLEMKDILQQCGIRPSALSAHIPLMPAALEAGKILGVLLLWLVSCVCGKKRFQQPQQEDRA